MILVNCRYAVVLALLGPAGRGQLEFEARQWGFRCRDSPSLYGRVRESEVFPDCQTLTRGSLEDAMVQLSQLSCREVLRKANG